MFIFGHSIINTNNYLSTIYLFGTATALLKVKRKQTDMDREISKKEKRLSNIRNIMIWGGSATVVFTAILLIISLLKVSVKQSDLSF